MCTPGVVHISLDKLVRPSTCADYLGVTIDTIAMEARLTTARLKALRALLHKWLKKQKATRKELSQLAGKLIWSAFVMPPGRTYAQRILDAMRSLREDYHHIRLSSEFKQDISAWLIS